jgi:hypothetical protein
MTDYEIESYYKKNLKSEDYKLRLNMYTFG